MKKGTIDEVLKIIIFAAGITIACILLTLAFTTMDKARQTANITSNNIDQYNQALQEADIVMYDGLSVRGCDVVNFYKKYLGEVGEAEDAPFTITVKTEVNKSYVDNSYIKQIQTVDNENYIKPTAKFVGKVIKNKNGIITEVIFEKE